MGSDRQRLSADKTYRDGGTEAIGQYVGVALDDDESYPGIRHSDRLGSSSARDGNKLRRGSHTVKDRAQDLARGAARENLEQTLARVDRYAWLLDSRFRIPGTGIRIGIDGLVGLVPVLGDLVGMILSMVILYEAVRCRAGKGVLLRMGGNILLEFVIGVVPLLGDAFDIYWRANLRNARLLRNHVRKRLQPAPPRHHRRKVWLLVVLVGVLLLLLYRQAGG